MDTERILLLVLTGAVSFALSYVGAAAGLILGHLRLPMLVYVLGNPVAGASTNLAVSGAGAVAGSLKHFRDGRVSAKVLLLMGLPSVVGAVLGVLFFVSLNPVWSHATIGLMLVYSGWELIKAGRAEAKAQGKADAPVPAGRFVTVWEVLIGLALGALAAVTGLMLGTIRLPMMIKYLKIDPGHAVGSNMVIGCLTAVAAAVTAYGAGGGLHPLSVLIVGPPTILGSYLGARKTGKLSPAALKRLVGWVVGASGVFMVALAAPALFRGSRPGEPVEPVEHLPDLRPAAPRPPQTSMGFVDLELADPDDDEPDDGPPP